MAVVLYLQIYFQPIELKTDVIKEHEIKTYKQNNN